MLSKNNLLIILSILLVLKFLYSPFIIWKEDLRFLADQELRKVERVEHILLHQDVIDKRSALLAEQMNQANELFPSENVDAYKLILQKKIESFCAKYGATLEVFDWVTTNPVEQTELLEGSINVRFTGSAGSVFAVYTAIESLPNSLIGNGTAAWSTEYSGAEVVRANVQLQMYFRGAQN